VGRGAGTALEVCKDWQRGDCRRGAACPYRHSNSDKVCKHWLRDLCKKNDACEFLHEYNLKKMPECQFFASSGALRGRGCGRGRRRLHRAATGLTPRRAPLGHCNHGDECKFLHIDPSTNRKVCPWYTRGFCVHGTTLPLPPSLRGATRGADSVDTRTRRRVQRPPCAQGCVPTVPCGVLP
jgi:hypothetical protein